MHYTYSIYSLSMAVHNAIVCFLLTMPIYVYSDKCGVSNKYGKELEVFSIRYVCIPITCHIIKYNYG